MEPRRRDLAVCKSSVDSRKLSSAPTELPASTGAQGTDGTGTGTARAKAAQLFRISVLPVLSLRLAVKTRELGEFDPWRWQMCRTVLVQCCKGSRKSWRLGTRTCRFSGAKQAGCARRLRQSMAQPVSSVLQTRASPGNHDSC